MTDEPEWWERMGGRVRRHPLLRRLRPALAVASWVSLAVVLAAAAFSSEFRAGLRSWIPCWLLVIGWLLAARSKTLRWTTVLRLFSLASLWAMVIAAVSARLSSFAGLDVADAGAAIAVAAIIEETLKLAPLAAVAIVAPGRARRLATLDWMLLGFTSGVAFQAVEDALRRVQHATNDSLFTQLLSPVDPWGDSSSGVPQYGWSLISGWSDNAGAAGYAGHHVFTGLVGVAIGLAVCTRGGRRRRLLWLLPPAMWLLVAIDHAAYNAYAADARFSEGAGSFPDWARWLWDLTGNGYGRGWLLVALALAALVVDAQRVVGFGSAPLARPMSLRPPLPGGAWWQPLHAAAHLVIADVATIAVAGPVKARTAAAVLREHREHAYRQDPARVRRLPSLLVTTAAVAGAGVSAVVLAKGIGTVLYGGWLAGLLDNLGDWWSELGTGGQIGLTVAAAALIVASGGTFGFALGATGAATTLLDHSTGTANLLRDPRATVRRAVANLTPQQAAIVLLEAAAGRVVPAAIGGAAGRAVRSAADEYVADRAGFWARRRIRWGDETGAIDPTLWSDPQARQAWVDDLLADPQRTRHIAGDADWLRYQRTHAGGQEVLVGEGDDVVWGDGITVDPDAATVLEAKYVQRPGRSLYEASPNIPPAVRDMMLARFDREMARYGATINDPANPVNRLRMFTNTDTAAAFLEQRARSILGPDIDLDIVVRKDLAP